VQKLLRVAGFAALAAIMLALLAQGGVASSAGAARYIVVLKQGVDSRAVANLHAEQYGVDVGFVYRHALDGYSAVVPEARVDELRTDANVAFLSPDGEVSATAQTLPTGVDRIEGDQSSTASGNGSGSVNVPVAVIDTGIDLDHPDLNIVGGVNCSTGPSFDDGNGHGTHVAGTIGAKDDDVGVVGMAPGTPLYAVRVLNNAGSGSFASVICGVDWVTGTRQDSDSTNDIAVANMSLGGSGGDSACPSNDAFHQAICNSVAAGVTYVVAAGNSGGDFSGLVPATFGEVLTVTAVADFNGQPGGGAAATCRSDVDDTAADFSSFTTTTSTDLGHTIAGPGVCILSTWKRGGYNTISGTSMATPHVAGAAALCIAGPCAGMSPSQVIARLRGDAAGRPASYGFLGDPNNPITTGGPNPKTLYYGYLAYAGSY
jgi:subtilisin